MPFPSAVAELRSNASLSSAIGGISVFQGLVSKDLVTWAHTHRLQVLAWTVNDQYRMDQLLSFGVDGITTANLGILQALAG